MWRCSHCRKKHSMREGSFFNNSRLKIEKIVLLMYLFVKKIRATDVLNLVSDVSEPTVLQWFAYFREVMSAALLRKTLKIGSLRRIVEIDKSKFGRKRKYARGAVRN